MSASEASQQANRAEMDPRRLVVISYLVFGVILALFFGHLLDAVLVRLNIKDAQLLEGANELKVSTLVGLAMAVGLGAWAWTNLRVKTLSLEVATELMRVTWPSWEETRISTIAVVVASLVAAILLFSMDTLAYKMMVDWLPALWGKL
jgi:preprotein translocase subunit SecE